ncbi:MAG: NAD-dependent epimerase/dehydratase family protein [Pleurocapsa sp.]
MKILVTGATGFIGGHLLPRLLQDKHEIVVATRHTNSVEKLSIPVPHVVVGEIDGNTDWSEALSGIDAVIHLAGRAHILQENVADPEAEFQRVNVTGTKNLVKQSLAAGVKRFIFISSIGAVATLSDRILTEETPPQPDTPYGRSKLEAEQALVKLTENTAMSWTILRPTLVYGEGNPGNMANLLKLIQLRIPLPLGAINNRRNFLYVGNLVDAIALCLTHSQAVNKLFLIGDTERLSTPELIQQIATALSISVTLIPIPLSFLKLLGSWGDFSSNILGKSLPINSNVVSKLSGSLAVDNSQICSSLNWQPPYSIKQGLVRGLSSK